MSRRSLLSCAAVAALAATGCGSDKSGPASGRAAGTTAAPATGTTTAPPQERTDAAGCVMVAQPRPKGPVDLDRPTLKLDPDKTYVVTLHTNCGDIAIRLDAKRAPKTAASFASLVKRGFYDGLTFHRVVAGFVVQGGDPLGNGQGGPGYDVVEKPPADLRYTRGVVAMAKAGVDPAGSSGSQFFIVTAQDAGLPPDYALVGKVVDGGMKTVNKIAAEPVNAESLPLNPVVIQDAELRVEG